MPFTTGSPNQPVTRPINPAAGTCAIPTYHDAVRVERSRADVHSAAVTGCRVRGDSRIDGGEGV